MLCATSLPLIQPPLGAIHPLLLRALRVAWADFAREGGVRATGSGAGGAAAAAAAAGGAAGGGGGVGGVGGIGGGGGGGGGGSGGSAFAFARGAALTSAAALDLAHFYVDLHLGAGAPRLGGADDATPLDSLRAGLGGARALLGVLNHRLALRGTNILLSDLRRLALMCGPTGEDLVDEEWNRGLLAREGVEAHARATAQRALHPRIETLMRGETRERSGRERSGASGAGASGVERAKRASERSEPPERA